MFHSNTFIDGSFRSTACVLSFYSKKARAQYPSQCAQRVETISYKQAQAYKKDGYRAVLMLWDENDPLNFVSCA